MATAAVRPPIPPPTMATLGPCDIGRPIAFQRSLAHRPILEQEQFGRSGSIQATSAQGNKEGSTQPMVPWRTRAPDRHGFDPVEREPGASIAVCGAEPET